MDKDVQHKPACIYCKHHKERYIFSWEHFCKHNYEYDDVDGKKIYYHCVCTRNSSMCKFEPNLKYKIIQGVLKWITY